MLIIPITTISVEIPSTMDLNGDEETIKQITIPVENTYNHTINITITLTDDISRTFFHIPEQVTIQKNTSKNIIFNMTFPPYNSNGQIIFNVDDPSETKAMNVHITVDKKPLSATMIPSTPEPGKSFAIVLNRNIDAEALLILNDETMKTTSIHNGAGIMSLELDEYGHASLMIFTENNRVTQTFNIGSVTLTMPEDVKLGETRTIKATIGDTLLQNHEIIIIEDDGDETEKKTDSNGEITYKFENTGSYTFLSSIGDETTYENIDIEWNGRTPTQIKIYDGETEIDDIDVDIEYIISVITENDEQVEEQIKLSIAGPNGVTKETTDSNGNVYWTPDINGYYTVSTDNTLNYLSSTKTIHAEGIPVDLPDTTDKKDEANNGSTLIYGFTIIILFIGGSALLILYSKGKIPTNNLLNKIPKIKKGKIAKTGIDKSSLL